MRVTFHENDGNHENDENDEDNKGPKQSMVCQSTSVLALGQTTEHQEEFGEKVQSHPVPKSSLSFVLHLLGEPFGRRPRWKKNCPFFGNFCAKRLCNDIVFEPLFQTSWRILSRRWAKWFHWGFWCENVVTVCPRILMCLWWCIELP